MENIIAAKKKTSTSFHVKFVLILIRKIKSNYDTIKRWSLQYAFIFPCGMKICNINSMELYVLRSFVGLFFLFPFRSLQLNYNNLLALFTLIAVDVRCYFL